jgi:hypothetical protein
MLVPNLVHGSRRTLFGFVFGNASFLIGLFDVFVLTFAFATFFDSSRHARKLSKMRASATADRL